MAERTPMMDSTIINSIREKPRHDLFAGFMFFSK